MTQLTSPPAERYAAFVERLAEGGGPRPAEDDELTRTIARVHADWRAGRLDAGELDRIREALRFTPETMQGFAYLKPNGYAGCYQIIDRIYRRYHTPDPALFNWDRYWQRHPAADAVRNRKEYFTRLVLDAVGRRGEVSVLNVASGPCRDVAELFDACPELPARVHCVEQDPRAIEHATRVCRDHLSKVTFRQANALRFTTDERFDLVWSAGLFDYLGDGLFAKLAARLARLAKPGGELVIGNFAESNPSGPYMELFDGVLHHRSADALRDLAARAGFAADRVSIRREPAGVNLFLHVSL